MEEIRTKSMENIYGNLCDKFLAEKAIETTGGLCQLRTIVFFERTVMEDSPVGSKAI